MQTFFKNMTDIFVTTRLSAALSISVIFFLLSLNSYSGSQKIEVICRQNHIKDCGQLSDLDIFSHDQNGYFECCRIVCERGYKESCDLAQYYHPVAQKLFWATSQPEIISTVKETSIQISPAPKAVLDYINLANKAAGRPALANIKGPFDKFSEKVRLALKEIPNEVLSLAAPGLMGIFLAKDIGSSGFTLEIFDEQRTSTGGFIVLDINSLSKTGNSWASWREQSTFNLGPSLALKITIDDPTKDNEIGSIRYLLLHELGHIIALSKKVYAGNYEPPSQDMLKTSSFLSFSWKYKETGYECKFDKNFQERTHLSFYSKALHKKISSDKILKAYSDLENWAAPRNLDSQT